MVRLAKAIGYVGLLLWLVGIYLWFHYDATRPHRANPSTGRIYALNTHGSVVYLTSSDQLTLYGFLGVGFGGLAGSIIFSLTRGKR